MTSVISYAVAHGEFRLRSRKARDALNESRRGVRRKNMDLRWNVRAWWLCLGIASAVIGLWWLTGEVMLERARLGGRWEAISATLDGTPVGLNKVDCHDLTVERGVIELGYNAWGCGNCYTELASWRVADIPPWDGTAEKINSQTGCTLELDARGHLWLETADEEGRHIRLEYTRTESPETALDVFERKRSRDW